MPRPRNSCAATKPTRNARGSIRNIRCRTSTTTERASTLDRTGGTRPRRRRHEVDVVAGGLSRVDAHLPRIPDVLDDERDDGAIALGRAREPPQRALAHYSAAIVDLRGDAGNLEKNQHRYSDSAAAKKHQTDANAWP